MRASYWYLWPAIFAHCFCGTLIGSWSGTDDHFTWGFFLLVRSLTLWIGLQLVFGLLFQKGTNGFIIIHKIIRIPAARKFFRFLRFFRLIITSIEFTIVIFHRRFWKKLFFSSGAFFFHNIYVCNTFLKAVFTCAFCWCVLLRGIWKAKFTLNNRACLVFLRILQYYIKIQNRLGRWICLLVLLCDNKIFLFIGINRSPWNNITKRSIVFWFFLFARFRTCFYKIFFRFWHNYHAKFFFLGFI